MNNLFCICIFLFFGFSTLTAQQVNLEVDGAIQIGSSEDHTPDPGTVRYNANTKTFEGYNGAKWIAFSSESSGAAEIVADIDGNIYYTIQIGSQKWMRQNLKTTRYRDGSMIPEKAINTDWTNTSQGSFCWYENNHKNGPTYGKLYNWFAVNDVRGLCPVGWHVPSETEAIDLGIFLGGTLDVGGKMKEAGDAHWAFNLGASNECGFTGLPGGGRDEIGIYYSISTLGVWWTATSVDVKQATTFLLQDINDWLAVGPINKNGGSSVRCIKD